MTEISEKRFLMDDFRYVANEPNKLYSINSHNEILEGLVTMVKIYKS